MRLRHLAWILGGFVTSAGAMVTAQSGASDPAVMQAIDRINAAFQARDAKAYETLTTADFVRVTSNGLVYGKRDWMGIVAAPGAARTAAKYDQVSVRVYGNGAVVTYRNMPGGGGPVSYLTRIMERQGTEWKMALAQSTDVKPPAPPTGAAPAPLPAWSASTPAEREVLTAFQGIQKANRENDLAAWERLAAPDHLIIAVDGTQLTRAERVKNLKAAAGKAGLRQPAEQQVRVMAKGDLAAVTWTIPGERALKVLARRTGQWQQVLQQSSPIVAAK